MKVFISYSHADEALVERLRKHLASLRRDGLITDWYDREIHAGSSLHDEISEELEAASIFIACVSADFIASDYCVELELGRALKRAEEGSLIVIPVILEPCDWHSSPLGKFLAVPKDGKPVSEFTNQNAAFLNVVQEIRRLVDRAKIRVKAAPAQTSQGAEFLDRQTNQRYRVRRDFDKLHKLDFLERSFKEIYEFFRTSADEIAQLDEIDTRLSEMSPNHFSCLIINRGMARKFETLHVRLGGSLGDINIYYGEQDRSNSSHGGFSVTETPYELKLSSGPFSFDRQDSELSSKEAAQTLWDDLLKRVGIDYDGDN